MQNTSYQRIAKGLRSDIEEMRDQHPIFTIFYIIAFLALTLIGWMMLGLWGVLIFWIAFAISLFYEYK